MPRRGKERERRGAFREGAVDPALGGFYGEEAEEAPFSSSDFPDDSGSVPYESGQPYNQFSPGPDNLAAQLTPEQLEWIHQTSHMEGYPPVDNASGVGDVDFEAYMSLEDLVIAEHEDESPSSSSPFDPGEDDEEMTVAGPSSRHSASTLPKHKSSSSKNSTRPRNSSSKKLSAPVQCLYEGCGQWFKRPTELHKHEHQAHDPHIPCSARFSDPRIVCDAVYHTRKDMLRHVRSAHPRFAEDPDNNVPEEGGDCPFCGKRINRDDNLRRHILKQHPKK
ncbi:hypothetical protein F5X68DRAFT_243502 [Plectosphaerella plurivora]|uniref:C2H2-type domain-containing protein n=1 Tax=Plectosphaerella plurivora TaxID=936078 RepID=A0A9P8VLZ8_9PEZI|nr:hypothetical protein F5X68DRAFT_243502 [Plectosphaerella plurivora]